MNWEEVKKWLEENSNDENVRTFIAGNIKTEEVKKLADDNKDLSKWLEGEKDKHSLKALETWKENNLDKLVDEKVKELYPDETEGQKEMRKLQEKISQMEGEKTRETLRNKALTIAGEKDLPTSILDHFIGKDEETTLKNLETLESALKDGVQKGVDARLKGSSYTPPGGDDNEGGSNDGNSFLDVIKDEQVKR
ncbi:DUF4355 domain-containing protein [Geomicrobium sediminis]|uniref:Gas vesicle protein n=1 Tax=Geomicrobium sediminis TaxID=1347788 RepID=A0ABS2P8G5_9BACL|nr:DUF4355 domain-containing protein [Geomicrobium sediminis]MBM7631108.1 gas vesicle protein [Geomicrobium sediminis]